MVESLPFDRIEYHVMSPMGNAIMNYSDKSRAIEMAEHIDGCTVEEVVKYVDRRRVIWTKPRRRHG